MHAFHAEEEYVHQTRHPLTTRAFAPYTSYSLLYYTTYTTIPYRYTHAPSRRSVEVTTSHESYDIMHNTRDKVVYIRSLSVC